MRSFPCDLIGREHICVLYENCTNTNESDMTKKYSLLMSNWMPTMNLVTQIVFEIFKFKDFWKIYFCDVISLQPDWLRAFFSQIWDFRRTVKRIMVHLLKPKNWHINGLNFVQNPKNPILRVFLGIIPKMSFFSKNPAPSVFYT